MRTEMAQIPAEQLDMQAIQAQIKAVDDKLGKQIETVDDKLDRVNGNVLELKGSVMSRAEAEAADGRRVSVERFEGEMGSVRDRITRVESGPQKLLGWLALIVSAGIGCFSLVLTTIGVGVALLSVIVGILIVVIPRLH